ncbi:hypothetical protein K488DRAFT_85037 [Vararia minispora EC-137]|uniref:Uncharacterized protein n=1 Tax=Vararia minispora EC-137 TaxID=1314806 RepID=A0ACB8QNV3_9AGAM|nr:hypothetical protein K488DRAFT_85037 [Vararia minispora EC-137]
MNLDQVDVVDVPTLIEKQSDVATDTLFHIQHARFQQLGGRVWDKCFSGITLPTYRTILDLEAEIRHFELEIPAALRYQTTQEERARPYLSFQNKIMSLELGAARFMLLAPFLFVHPVSNEELVCMKPDDRKLAEFHRHAKAVCLLFAKRQLALLQMFQAAAKDSFLTWPSLAVTAHMAAMMLVVAIIVQPDHPENDELDEWIVIAEDLFKVLKPYNALAPHALQYMEAIRRRSVVVRCVSRPPGPPQYGDCRGPSPEVTMNVMQRMERAIKILAQPVSSMADRLGYDTVLDPLWATLRPGVYASRFPGIESLGRSVDPQDLENFLDGCASVQSCMPPVLDECTRT